MRIVTGVFIAAELSLLVVGALALLAHQGIGLGALKGIGTLSVSNAWVCIGGGLGSLAVTLLVSFIVFHSLQKKQVSSDFPVGKAPLLTPSVNGPPLPVRLATGSFQGMRMARAPNFCYADSVFAAMFLGMGFRFIPYLKKRLSQPQGLTEQESAFLTHLYHSIVLPLQNGKDVSAEEMKRCQQLVWDAGWNDGKEMTDPQSQADSFQFHKFLCHLLQVPSPVVRKKKNDYSFFEMAFAVGAGVKNELTLEKILSLRIQEICGYIAEDCLGKAEYSQEEMEPYLQPAFSLLPALVLTVNHDSSQRLNIPTDISLEKVFPIPTNLRLKAIVNHHSNHYWSFFVRIGETDQWIRYNDLRSSLEIVSFSLVQEEAGKHGRLFYFDVNPSS